MMFFKKRDDTSQLEKLIAEYTRTQSPKTLDRLLELFPTVPLYYGSFQVEIGPDHFPYLHLKLRAEHEHKTSLKEIAAQALDGGFGVTINKSGNSVDWVFSLGDLIPLARIGRLITHHGHVGLKSTRLTENIEVQVGAPNEDIIPLSVRKYLRNYAQTVLHIPDPKFYLMLNPKDNPPWTILFNFSRKDFGSEEEYQNALRCLSWFFPKSVFTGCIENDQNQFFEI